MVIGILTAVLVQPCFAETYLAADSSKSYINTSLNIGVDRETLKDDMEKTDGEGETSEEDTEKPEDKGQWIYNRSKGKWEYLKNGMYYTSEFAEIDGVKYYFNDYCYMSTGWEKIKGKWYRFSGNGSMITGWTKSGGKWSYLEENGACTGWRKIDGKYYYFTKSAIMKTGWKKSNGYWYYLTGNGLVKGWSKINNKYYYFNKYGTMQTGWQFLNYVWYYFGDDGKMRTSKEIEALQNIKIDEYLGSLNIETFLKSHENDFYYLGTPYRGVGSINWNHALENPDKYCFPNGEMFNDLYNYYDFFADGPGMNCAGFVAHVFRSCGGDLEKLGSYNPYGAYSNMANWVGTIMNQFICCKKFDSLENLLESGLAKKGDLVFYTVGKNGHIAFFWGDKPSDNNMWQSEPIGRNIFTNEIKKGNQIALMGDKPNRTYYLVPVSHDDTEERTE